MRTLLPPAPGSAPVNSDRELRVRELGRKIAAGQAAAGGGRSRALEDRGMELLARDPALRAALFRLVDVAPACADRRDLATHLASLLREGRPIAPVSLTRRASLRRATSPAVGTVAALAVHRMAKRFIVGAAPQDAVPALERLWRA